MNEAEARVRMAAQAFIDAMTDAVSQTVKQLQESGLIDIANPSPMEEETSPLKEVARVTWATAMEQQLTVVTSTGALFEANAAKCVDGKIYLRYSGFPNMDWYLVEDPDGWVKVLC